MQMHKNFEDVLTGIFTRDYRWAPPRLPPCSLLAYAPAHLACCLLAPATACQCMCKWRAGCCHCPHTQLSPLCAHVSPINVCRHKTETCRILVTVPACLELLLLGPTSQAWVQKIRYVILDEVPAAACLSLPAATA